MSCLDNSLPFALTDQKVLCLIVLNSRDLLVDDVRVCALPDYKNSQTQLKIFSLLHPFPFSFLISGYIVEAFVRVAGSTQGSVLID